MLGCGSRQTRPGTSSQPNSIRCAECGECGGSMREGTGEARVAVAPEAVVAYLADPRHAPEWFAGVEFTEQLEEAPRAGMTWRFVQVRSGNRVVPVRMEVYDPPMHFV